ncbi:hypothetical protein KAR91_67425 [Candidatus Pacearchaeota archaeon]|nr:hypothetical protein [Candidatus Pacearchaeota archaeon]
MAKNLQLFDEIKMTITDLADVAGVSRDTIRRIGKKTFPDLHKKGVKTFYNEAQCNLIIGLVRKKNLVSSSRKQSAEVPKQTAEVDYELIGNMIGMAVKAALEPVLMRLDGVQQTPRVGMIEAPKVEYFTLAGYCSMHKIGNSLPELRKMGMDLRKLSKEAGKPPKPIPDTRWGKVNSYHIDILDEYFEV